MECIFFFINEVVHVSMKSNIIRWCANLQDFFQIGFEFARLFIVSMMLEYSWVKHLANK